MFVIPVTRDSPKHTAWVIYGLILANSFIFLVTCSLFTVSGVVSSAFREMTARITSRSMTCPGCRASMPRRGAGRYRCSACRTRFRVNEEGDVAVLRPPKSRDRPPDEGTAFGDLHGINLSELTVSGWILVRPNDRGDPGLGVPDSQVPARPVASLPIPFLRCGGRTAAHAFRF